MKKTRFTEVYIAFALRQADAGSDEFLKLD